MAQEQVLVVPGRYKEIKRICEFVAAGAADAGFDAKTIFHLELCCDEASTNIIEHAYGEEDVGDIAISYAVDDDDFIIVLRDTGQAFNPGDVPPPAINGGGMPADDLADQMRVGGLGLLFKAAAVGSRDQPHHPAQQRPHALHEWQGKVAQQAKQANQEHRG